MGIPEKRGSFGDGQWNRVLLLPLEGYLPLEHEALISLPFQLGQFTKAIKAGTFPYAIIDGKDNWAGNYGGAKVQVEQREVFYFGL